MRDSYGSGKCMRMKLYVIAMTLWLLVLSSVAMSKPSPLTYTIRFDRESEHSAAIKQEVLARYRELIRGVHEESEAILLAHNLDLFMWEDDMLAEWIDGTLVITIGDGTGAQIYGDLVAQEICLPEVKTRSLFQEWFSAE